MPVMSLLAAYLLFASLSLHGLAFLLYLHDPPSPELRSAAVVIFLLGVVLLVVALLLWVGDEPGYERFAGVRVELAGARVEQFYVVRSCIWLFIPRHSGTVNNRPSDWLS